MTFSKSAIPAAFVILWATGFIGARYAMPWAEPFAFLAARFLLAFAILGCMAIAVGSPWGDRRSAIHSAMAGALIHGIYLGGVFWAIHNGMPAGLSALIVGLQPLITALLAGSLLGERIRARHWAGLATGFAGVLIVLAPRMGDLSSGVNGATLAACFVAVFSMSAGTILQKRYVTDGHLITGTFWQYVGATLVMLVASATFETQQFEWSGELLLAMAWLVIVLSIGAIFLLMIMIRDGEVSKVASLFYLVPATTALIAWVLFGEDLSLVQIVGMALATFGVALATSRNPATPPAA